MTVNVRSVKMAFNVCEMQMSIEIKPRIYFDLQRINTVFQQKEHNAKPQIIKHKNMFMCGMNG